MFKFLTSSFFLVQTQAMEIKEKVFSKFLKYGVELFRDDDIDDTSDEIFIKMRSEWDSFKLGLAKKKKG